MKKTMMFLATGLLLALPSAYGTVVTAGDTGIPAAAFSITGTPSVVDSATGTGTTNNLSFSYLEYVLTDASDSLCPTCLDFAIVAQNTGTDAIDRISTGSFSGFITDVGFYSFSGATNPVTVGRSSDGSAIDFDFSGLAGGETTAALIIKTNATSYAAGTITAQDGVSANGLVPVFAPAVPEPMSMGLMGGGLLLLGLLGYRRRKAVKL